MDLSGRPSDIPIMPNRLGTNPSESLQQKVLMSQRNLDKHGRAVRFASELGNAD